MLHGNEITVDIQFDVLVRLTYRISSFRRVYATSRTNLCTLHALDQPGKPPLWHVLPPIVRIWRAMPACS